MQWMLRLLILAALVIQPAAGQNQHIFTDQTSTTGWHLELRAHPDDRLAAGDTLSFDVFLYTPTTTAPADEQQVTIEVIQPIEITFKDSTLIKQAEGYWRASLPWAWDTSGLPPGVYTLRVEVQPARFIFIDTLTLTSPRAEQPVWRSTETACCILNYMEPSPTAENLEEITQILDEQAASAAEALGMRAEYKLVINLVPRMIGHGGFASEEITMSDPERDYLNMQLPIIFHHELVHKLDALLGNEVRVDLLVEGLAVYLSGGHFKYEPVMERAAALIELGLYIPLPELAASFYPAQHEIAYIEGGALIEYLVDTYGWERFEQLHRNIPDLETTDESQELDAALQDQLGITLQQLDQDFRSYLSEIHVSRQVVEDVSVTILYYDVARAYQRRYDPSAHFRSVWLPNVAEMREKDITRDLYAGPQNGPNRTLEILIARAGQAFLDQDYPTARSILQEVLLYLPDADITLIPETTTLP